LKVFINLKKPFADITPLKNPKKNIFVFTAETAKIAENAKYPQIC
jgi:hypothetical protein